jgi:DNA-binding Lrp family transcriptional regulator
MLNNVEKEKIVIDLYYNQRKNVRQIAQEARISFRDIAAIIKKKEEAAVNDVGNVDGNGNNKNNKYYYYSNEKCTQAYRLFSEGKKPFEVAIELGIREVQVNKFFRKFWKLKNLNQLYKIYPQIRCYLPSLLKLHKVLKKKGLTADNVEWFANAIETGVIKLPELQSQRQSLQKEILDKQRQKQEVQRDLHVINKRIVDLADVEKMHQNNIDTLQNDIEHLFNERSELQQFVSRFKNSDKRYLQIKGIAEEVVDRFLAELKSLLNSALVAVVEA